MGEDFKIFVNGKKVQPVWFLLFSHVQELFSTQRGLSAFRDYLVSAESAFLFDSVDELFASFRGIGAECILFYFVLPLQRFLLLIFIVDFFFRGFYITVMWQVVL